MGENAIDSDPEIQSNTTTRQPADQEPPARFLRWTMKIGLFLIIFIETRLVIRGQIIAKKYINFVYLAANRTQPID